MRIILIIVFILIIMIIALSVSKQYIEKTKFYNRLKIFLEELKVNMSFKQAKLKECLSLHEESKTFRQFIMAYKEYLDTGMLNFDNIKILNNEEIEELINIISSIGRFDVKNEILQLDSFIAKVNTRLNNANEEQKKICPMIIKLSLLFAIGIVILLI